MAPPTPPPDRLYNGPDLSNAAARSTVSRGPLDRLQGAGNGLAILGDVLRARLNGARPRFEFAGATGCVPGSDTPLTAAYAGTGANRAWCLSLAFARYDETELRSCASPGQALQLLEGAANRVNFLFVDGIAADALSGIERPFVLVPAWIKQRLKLLPDWAAQLGAMRRGTRQEAARMLRKYGYDSRLSRADDDFDRFYSHLYVPYMSARFGQRALLVERDRFVRECRRGVLLQLLHREKVVGGALLRRVGNTMAIVWTALDPHPGAAEVRGITDTLDYFSVLYAHRKGCRWLDFGPSRPDLYDGPLRYKSKWGTEVTAGLVPQAAVGWSCTGHSPAEREFLLRHAFVARREGRLCATAFVEGGADRDGLRATIRALAVPGIDSRRIVALSAASDDLRRMAAEAEGITLAEAGSITEAIKATTL